MAILLVGSTGNGKSTLGNYLLNPNDEHINKKQTFVVARDNKPQTQIVKPFTGTISVKGRGQTKITVIDTPGLNEGAVQDLEHMIGIIQAIKDQKEIRTCILVVKFNSKIDAQYKATVKYYSQLLPDLFENNVIIVMTDFTTDDRSIQMRKRQGIDVEQVKNNTVEEIVECARMSYSPTLFTIDCLPYDSNEHELNRGIRDSLLEFIFFQQPTPVIDFKVAKPDDIQKEDDKDRSKYDGEINGFSERLKKVHKTAQEALDKLRIKEAEITEEDANIASLEFNLNELDTSNLVAAANWSVSKEWKVFKTLTEHFELHSDWDVYNVRKWTNGKCVFTECAEHNNSAKGNVVGKFMRGIYANVKLETQKKLKYADKIRDLKSTIGTRKSERQRLLAERKDISEEHKEHKDQLKELAGYIDARREDIKHLSQKFMTLDEARERLKKLKERV